MENFFKQISFIILCSVSFTFRSAAQETDLAVADSLFASSRYTEAFKKYEYIFEEGQASPAMLVRMAFIKEGLGNYADALYYLNLYYQQTSDKSVLTKMREIAEEHHLTGYEYTDFKFFMNFLKMYLQEIILCLLALSLFLTVYALRRRRKDERPIAAVVVQVLVVALVCLLVNGVFFEKSAIISDDHALLMTGPSAGSEPLHFIEKGHRVVLLQQGEVWDKILWDGEPVYIRSKNIRVL